MCQLSDHFSCDLDKILFLSNLNANGFEDIMCRKCWTQSFCYRAAAQHEHLPASFKMLKLVASAAQFYVISEQETVILFLFCLGFFVRIMFPEIPWQNTDNWWDGQENRETLECIQGYGAACRINATSLRTHWKWNYGSGLELCENHKHWWRLWVFCRQRPTQNSAHTSAGMQLPL